MPDLRGDPHVLVRLAQVLVQRLRTKEAIAAVRIALISGGSDLAPAVALSLARVAREIDPPIARAAARQVLDRHDADADLRRRAEQLLGEIPADLPAFPLS